VTQLGEELSTKKYNWDEETRTFSTTENNLVLNFSGIGGVTFDTGHSCTFKTASGCTFKTESNCTFDSGPYCTFKTGSSCTFKTGSSCTFDTGSSCTFDTGSDCTFTCKEKCVCIRRDIFEIIEIPVDQKIKLSGSKIPGFVLINPERTITIDGKEIKLSEDGCVAEELKVYRGK